MKIILFKEARMLKGIRTVPSKLVMETNAGTKQIPKKGNILGYAQVWVEPTVVSNIL